ncbi:MAG: hypothetical protein PWP64_1306 [Candidatus Cloacimonadota bacterium]|nr:hypothetical protein [Candidatus Cloacimonadota bacterium]
MVFGVCEALSDGFRLVIRAAAADNAIGIGDDIAALGLGIEGELELTFISLAADIFGIFVDITGLGEELLLRVEAELTDTVFFNVAFQSFSL